MSRCLICMWFTWINNFPCILFPKPSEGFLGSFFFPGTPEILTCPLSFLICANRLSNALYGKGVETLASAGVTTFFGNFAAFTLFTELPIALAAVPALPMPLSPSTPILMEVNPYVKNSVRLLKSPLMIKFNTPLMTLLAKSPNRFSTFAFESVLKRNQFKYSR